MVSSEWQLLCKPLQRPGVRLLMCSSFFFFNVYKSYVCFYNYQIYTYYRCYTDYKELTVSALADSKEANPHVY